MRVPRIGSIYTPRFRVNNNVGHKKLTDPPSLTGNSLQNIGFGTSVAYYLKKYNTLPYEIQKNLSPKDAIDMFREMEYIADGKVKRKSIGQGSESKVYENPWLKGYYLMVLNSLKDASLANETLYTKINHLGDAVWCDKDDMRIQILGS